MKQDYRDIWDANLTINTTKIKGKEYAEVSQRVKAFRMVFPRGRISKQILKLDGEPGKRTVLIQCDVFDEVGNLLATDFAEEREDSSFINRTSFIENCSTSATGRALGMIGFGIDTSIASYEEVSNAIKQQEQQEDLNSKKETF